MLRSMVCEITVLRAISLYYLCCKWHLVTSHRRTHTCVRACTRTGTHTPSYLSLRATTSASSWPISRLSRCTNTSWWTLSFTWVCYVLLMWQWSFWGYLYASVLNSLAAHCVLTYVCVLFSESRLCMHWSACCSWVCCAFRDLLCLTCFFLSCHFQFMEEIDKEISEMKITLNARARICAEEFLKNVSVYIGEPHLSVSSPLKLTDSPPYLFIVITFQASPPAPSLLLTCMLLPSTYIPSLSLLSLRPSSVTPFSHPSPHLSPPSTVNPALLWPLPLLLPTFLQF